ncbi:polysaccharide pyruvyl transferase family protein [Methylobacterium sp. 77]|uniref:polysaccharide pyruvyl transferase family protein n=1 Tax=Methylobacterium sp. 77 TaxID=1101192 RepID=UPI00037A7779|nr:polysaccharide pyruvyl transferase family protein [Methylobacterium sp. 77]
MKIGILDFSYANAAKSIRKLHEDSFYTVNLGDNAQSIAARQLLSRLGCDTSDIVTVDRDTLPTYSGGPVALIMNGVFYERNFPVPNAVIPIFVGFCTKSIELIQRYRDWFKRYEPIGCRDIETARLFEAEGIEASVTGCVTMTFPLRVREPRKKRLFVVHGSGAGKLPSTVLKHIPHHLLDDAEFLFHRLPVSELPLADSSRRWIERYEEDILDRYRNEASLVLTPLLHVASPCLAMGVPLVLCRKDRDTRFGFLQTLTRVYTPDEVSEIVWNPSPVDLRVLAESFGQELKRRLDLVRA